MIHTSLAEGFTPLGHPAFIVTTDTGYRAELPACPCDRTPCTRKAGHPVKADPEEIAKYANPAYATRYAREEHERTHCHAMYARHREQAEAFALAVEKTYKKGRTR